MIIEIATAAAMYWGDRQLATDSDIPPMRPRAESCSRYRGAELAQCLDRKLQTLEPDPYAAMWDSDWVSSVSPIPEVEQKKESAKTANPNVAKKPLK